MPFLRFFSGRDMGKVVLGSLRKKLPGGEDLFGLGERYFELGEEVLFRWRGKRYFEGGFFWLEGGWSFLWK